MNGAKRFLSRVAVTLTLLSCYSRTFANKSLSKLPRVYTPNKLLNSKEVVVDVKIGHYLKNVLRLRKGSQFRLFNEFEGEFLCEFTDTADSSKRPKVIIIENIKFSTDHLRLNFPLYFAPIKNSKLKLLFEGCTELGVTDYVPVITQNVVCQYDDFESYKPRLIESIEQSEQFIIPTIRSPLKIKELLASWPVDDGGSDSSSHLTAPVLFVCRERSLGSSSFRATISENLDIACNAFSSGTLVTASLLPGGVSAPGGVLIGPEGGFTSEVLDLMASFPFVRFVSLGSSVLRTEIAAIAAVSALTDVLRDLRDVR